MDSALTFDLHRVASQSIVSNKIADLLSRTTASQAIIYHESSATSQATNTQSTEVSPQESSLSSQEMILDSKDQVPPTKELKGDAVTNSESADRVDKQSDSINGRQQISDSIKYSGKVTTTTQSPPLGFGSTYKTDSAAGQKRMANGEIKPSNSTSPVDQLRSEFSPMSSSSPRKSPQRSPQIGQVSSPM